MKEIIALGKNFLLVKERESTNGEKGRTVIRSSGYTTTKKALSQNWFLTQLQTVPHMNREHLPDPFIFPQKVFDVYDVLDCNLFNLFFLPECKGLDYAAEEVVDYLEKDFYPKYQSHAMVLHSKGALFGIGATKYLQTNENIAMIAPTIGTIMGDEQLVYEKMKKYVDSRETKISKFLTSLQVNALLKPVTHITCSRRPIDYDMAIGSKFLEELDFSNLERHCTMLVTAECLDDVILSELPFQYYAKFVGLDKNADGMVALSNQKLVANFVDEINHIVATHPTALNKSVPYIKKFLGVI